MNNSYKVAVLVQKANAVITSCKTSAQMRVASTFVHRALAEIGKLSGDKVFRECHFGFLRLMQAKRRQLKLRNGGFF